VYGIKRSVRYQKRNTKEILSEKEMNEKIETEEQIKVEQIFSDVEIACKMKKIEILKRE